MTIEPKVFFPGDILERRQKWYMANLAPMNEPSLFTPIGGPRTLIARCLWLRAFRPSLCVRIQAREDGSGLAVTKEISCDPAEGKPAKLVKDAQKIIEPSSVGELSNLIDNISFFDISTNEEFPIGLDGERWILEVVQKGAYHIVDRYCPDAMPRDRSLVQLGEFLLKLAED